jgi:hypothetical protein
MPINIDTVNTIVAHGPGSASPKSRTHCVNKRDNSRGKKNTHNTTSGDSREYNENAIIRKGVEKAHMNPASKPDQMCLLLIKSVNFLTTVLTC